MLLIAFGSVVAAGLPLAIALMGLGISSGGLIVLLANVVDVPDWTTAVSGLIGIGVGIDYSLLVLTRFRSAMNEGKDRHDAVVEAVTTAGRSVVIAGGTVMIAIFGLMLTGPVLHVRRRARVLARRPGRDARVDQPAARASLLPRPEGRPPANPVPGPHAEDGGERRVARRALEPRGPAPAVDRSRSPRPLLLLALAAPALGMRLGFPDAGNDPPDTMTRQAYDLNTEGFGPGTNGPLVIARRAARDAAAQVESASWPTTLRAEPGVAFVPDPTINDDGQRGDRHRDPDRLAPGRGDARPGQPPARRRPPDGARATPASPPTSAA